MRGRPRFLAVSMIVALAACGTEPSPPPISGQWGAPELEFIATSRAATFRLPCEAEARFSGPIHADGAGRFELAGRVVQRFVGSYVRVTGVLNGADLTLTPEFTYAGACRQAHVLDLHTGVRPDFSQSVCLRSPSPGPDDVRAGVCRLDPCRFFRRS